jgi:hypothetical protein
VSHFGGTLATARQLKKFLPSPILTKMLAEMFSS